MVGQALTVQAPGRYATAMNVQFLCPGCNQPLEVDQEWASKPVACPYCRKTVMVPANSTFHPATVGPQASPLTPPEYGPTDSPAAQATPSKPSALAQWALALSVAAFGLWLVFGFTTAPKILELTGSENPTPQDVQRVLLEQVESGSPDWMLLASFTVLASMAAWVAGLVCGIVALTQPPRPRLAVIALAINGLTLLTCCVGPM